MLRELHDRVTGYTAQLQADLDRVQTMITNVHDLSESNEPAQVHGLLLALNQRLLDDKWVQVPRQYGLADIYMLAMNRFMEFAKSDAYTILMSDDSEELTLRVKGLETPVTFRFVLGTQGGAYLVEQRTGEQVAFWLPEQRQLLFNSEALTNLLVVDFREKEASTAVRKIAAMLLVFGRYMEQTLGYSVDYNILETADNYIYQLIPSYVPDRLLDRLFVHSAHSGYYLKRTVNGAAMVVKNNIEVRILQLQGVWHLQVVDGHDAASWLDTLVEFDFLASWYLEMRDYIEVASNPKVFKLEHQGVKAQPLEATVAMVEVLQPQQ